MILANQSALCLSRLVLSQNTDSTMDTFKGSPLNEPLAFLRLFYVIKHKNIVYRIHMKLFVEWRISWWLYLKWNFVVTKK